MNQGKVILKLSDIEQWIMKIRILVKAFFVTNTISISFELGCSLTPYSCSWQNMVDYKHKRAQAE